MPPDSLSKIAGLMNRLLTTIDPFNKASKFLWGGGIRGLFFRAGKIPKAKINKDPRYRNFIEIQTRWALLVMYGADTWVTGVITYITLLIGVPM